MDGKRQAVIHMVSESPDDRMEVSLTGDAQRQDETVLLHWAERLPEDDGLSQETFVSLRARPGHAMMQRRGPWSVSMIFEPGAARESVYHTAYGDLPITVAGREVAVGFGADGGRITIAYGLTVRGGSPDPRRMTIEWRWADADSGES